MAVLPALVMSQSAEQSVVSTGGNFNSSSNLSLSYTIGEPVIQTFDSPDIILTQGFQQPIKITTTDIEEQEESTIGITAYPNPTTSRLVLELNTEQKRDVRLDVYDVSGKKQAISSGSMTVKGNTTRELNFSKLSPASYFIRVTTEDGKELQTIKVQKIK